MDTTPIPTIEFNARLFARVEARTPFGDHRMRDALTTYILAHGLLAETGHPEAKRRQWTHWALAAEATIEAYDAAHQGPVPLPLEEPLQLAAPDDLECRRNGEMNETESRRIGEPATSQAPRPVQSKMQARREEYYKNPTLCPVCGKPLNELQAAKGLVSCSDICSRVLRKSAPSPLNGERAGVRGVNQNT